MIDIGQGEALKALKELLRRGNVRFETGLPEAVAAMVAQWRHLTDDGGAPLLVARTNQQLRMISEAVRRDRRAHGELGDIEVTFTGRLPNGDAAPVSLSAGDRVRFLAKNKQLDVINGSAGEVVELVQGATPLGTQLTVLVGNRHISFSLSDLADADNQVLLGWDYGWSGFGSQGTTVEDALVLADANFDRHLAYVTASRARNKTVLFVDSSSVDAIEADLSEHGALDQEAERRLKQKAGR